MRMEREDGGSKKHGERPIMRMDQYQSTGHTSLMAVHVLSVLTISLPPSIRYLGTTPPMF